MILSTARPAILKTGAYLAEEGAVSAGPGSDYWPTSGLHGYPIFSLKNVIFQMDWSPDLEFGRRIMLESSLQPAVGFWVPMEVINKLQTETPDGDRSAEVKALSPELIAGGGQ
jgi:hypothetical protein